MLKEKTHRRQLISCRRKEIAFGNITIIAIQSGQQVIKNMVKLIESDPYDWSPCAKMSHDVYILSRDKDPRFRDELKIRDGDLKYFANSLFYLAPTYPRSTLLFSSPFFPKIQTINGTSVCVCSSSI